jgi:hypothetical protein
LVADTRDTEDGVDTDAPPDEVGLLTGAMA